MKKLIIILISCLVLIGCTKEPEPVLVEITATPTIAPTSTPTPTPEPTSTPTPEPSPTSIPVEDLSVEDRFSYYANNHIYYLGDLDSNQVLDVIVEVLNKLPEEGTKFEDLEAIYSEPVAGNLDIDAKNRWIEENYIIDDKDCLERVCYSNAFVVNEDGTISYPTDSTTQIDLSFIIKDRDKAIEIYDLLIANEKTWHKMKSVEDNREDEEAISWSVMLSSSTTGGRVSISFGDESNRLSVRRTFLR